MPGWQATVEATFRAWDDGRIARYVIENRLMEIMSEENVEALVAALPAWYRPHFETRLRELADVAEPSQLFSVFGGIRRETDAQRANRERQERAESERLVAVARSWASRRP